MFPRRVLLTALVVMAITVVSSSQAFGASTRHHGMDDPQDAQDATGNSLTQAPAKALRTDCVAGDQPSCVELQLRVDNAALSGKQRGLLCLFYRPVSAQTAAPVDFVHLRALLGADAPPGVLDAVDVLESGAVDTAVALASLDGYVGPICATATKPDPIVIRSDRAIGTFKTKIPAGGTFADAREAFGPPTSVRRIGEACRVKWGPLGLKTFFANLGGDNPCAAETGFFTVAFMIGEHWRTENGLAVGQRLSKLKRKFPSAQRGERRGSRTEWWLVVRREAPAFGGARVPRLLALVSKGRVVAFELNQPNAGE